MIPMILAAMLVLAQATPVPPVPPVPPAPPAEPAPPVPVLTEMEETDSSGYLGVVPAEIVKADVKRLGLKEEAGALVKEVIEGSPAAKAGLKVGDVITAFGGSPVQSAAQLRRLVRETPGGRTVNVGLFRNGSFLTPAVTLGEQSISIRRLDRSGMGPGIPEYPKMKIVIDKDLEEALEQSELSRGELEQTRQEMERAREEMEKALQETDLSRKEVEIYLKDAEEGLKHLERLPLDPDHPYFWLEKGDEGENFNFQFHGAGKPRLGVGLQELTPQLAEYFGLKDRTGALVTSVNDGSPAAKAGLKAGDVILSVNGKAVEDAGDVRLHLADLQEGPVEVKVLRNRKEMTFRPVLEKPEERVIIREKRVKECPMEKEKKIIIRVDEPGASSL